MLLHAILLPYLLPLQLLYLLHCNSLPQQQKLVQRARCFCSKLLRAAVHLLAVPGHHAARAACCGCCCSGSCSDSPARGSSLVTSLLATAASQRLRCTQWHHGAAAGGASPRSSLRDSAQPRKSVSTPQTLHLRAQRNKRPAREHHTHDDSATTHHKTPYRLQIPIPDEQTQLNTGSATLMTCCPKHKNQTHACSRSTTQESGSKAKTNTEKNQRLATRGQQPQCSCNGEEQTILFSACRRRGPTGCYGCCCCCSSNCSSSSS